MPQITFRTTGRDVTFKEGDSVNLLRASGNCGTDRVLVEAGADQLSTPRKRERERLGDLLAQGYRLACQTYVDGDVTVSWDPDQKGLDEDSRAADRLKRIWLGASDTA
jgi:uncharacterized 2Fe-2S/4Fe-4S cluster protein (DUF4445 family)